MGGQHQKPNEMCRSRLCYVLLLGASEVEADQLSNKDNLGSTRGINEDEF